MEYEELEGRFNIDRLKEDDVYVDDITHYEHNDTIVIQLSNGYQITFNA